MIEYPNTFPFPNEIINGWNKKLKGSELKVLLVVVRQTLGWILDPATGMRKEEDWIAYQQFKEKTGLATRSLSVAIDSLVKYKLIEIRDRNGNLLNTPYKRMLEGKKRGSFFYRLNLTVLKSKTDCVKKENSTVLKRKSNKINSLQNNTPSIVSPKKFSSLKDIKEKDLLEISEKYKIPLAFVKLCLEKMTNWIGAKGRRYRNYKRALMNWVLKEAENKIENRKGGFVDATQI